MTADDAFSVQNRQWHSGMPKKENRISCEPLLLSLSDSSCSLSLVVSLQLNKVPAVLPYTYDNVPCIKLETFFFFLVFLSQVPVVRFRETKRILAVAGAPNDGDRPRRAGFHRSSPVLKKEKE
eukprot:m.38913 g.38913  ORF g.38913 m.38913 type:complete len:123 (+) comp32641_c1_seq2:401-769(+)